MKKLPKLRRRLLHLLLCLLSAAVAVAAVGAADALESRYAARVDLSFNRVTTQSSATRAVLSALQKDVHAYAVFSEGNELQDLYALLDRYQADSPHFTWSRENLSRNPLLLQWVSDDVNDSAVTTDCVILRCEETGRTRVLTWDDYMSYTYDSETGTYAFTGLTYEKALTEAVLSVTTEELPRVQLLQGHGLRSANYEIIRVNLKSGGVPDPAAPLMILSPTMDANEAELEQLLAFVRAGGSLFVTADFTDPDELPNLYAFYRLYGVTPVPGVVAADENDRSSYYSSVVELTPALLPVDGVTDGMAASGADYLILAPARALEVNGTGTADLLIRLVLQSGEGSYLRTAESGAVTLERQAEDPAGPFPLAVLCDRAFEDGTRSRAFFIGSSSPFVSDTMFALTYSNELMLQVMQYLQGRAPLSLDIVARDAVRPQLNPRGSVLPTVLLTLPPLLIAILAAAILLPRKYL